MNQITDAFRQGIYTPGICVDFSKSTKIYILWGFFIDFDTVIHNISLEKLKAYGIQSENLKWFRSYLSQRQRFIPYNDSKIETKIVKYGVPQGTILGPLLFLIFENSLNDSTKALDPVFFADDTNL